MKTCKPVIKQRRDMTHHGRTTRNVILAATATLLLAASAFAQDTETVLHTFTGGKDGAIGGIQLVSDSAGNLYGTTANGGNKSTSCEPYTGVPGCGVVFKLARDAHGDWKETVLHTFTGGKDGALPFGGVILDSAGNLYGTATFGGNKKPANCHLTGYVPGCGVVFKLTPQAHGDWKETVLHTFTGGKDGREPFAGLTFDQTGNLYGTATRGGDTHCKGRTPYGCGVAFKLTPTAEGPWTEAVIHTFETTGTGGYLPYGGLTFDSAGNLYGTTYLGGDNSVSCFGAPDNGCGVVYELTPRAHGPWKETVLWAFTGGTDGGIPLFYVTLDSSGNVYGTTIYGGDTTANNCLGGNGVPAGCGVVFELAQGTWGETVLYAFTGGSDGAFDLSPVVFDSSGNLYGNTANGGDLGGACNGGCGVVFQLTPNPWTENVLYAFTGGADGSGPESNLILDSAENIFGVTEGGGNLSECSGYGCGVVFELSPHHRN